MVSFQEVSSGKRLVCCALTELYSVYYGRPVYSLCIRAQRYIYLGLYISAIDLPTVLYISYRPPYRTIYQL